MSYSSNCSIFRTKKLETTSTTKKQQNLKNGEVKFRLNIDVRKETENSRLNAIKQLIMFVKGRLNFSCKSTTAANVDLTESLLYNWLKNNHITADKYMLFAGWEVRIVKNCDLGLENRLPEAAGRGQHFQDRGHSFCSWMLRNILERRRHSDSARSLTHSLTHSLDSD